MDIMELKLNELVKKNKKELIEDIKEYIQDEFARLNSKNYQSDFQQVEEYSNETLNKIIKYLEKL